MIWPQPGTPVSTRVGMAVASNNVREGAPAELSGAVTTANGILAYKFYPRYTGEYLLTADIKNTGGSVQSQLSVAFGNREVSTTYLNTHGRSTIVNSTLPIGSTLAAIVTPSATNGIIRAIGNNATAVYASVNGYLNVVDLTPIYVVLTGNGSDTCFIRNITLSYDVVR